MHAAALLTLTQGVLPNAQPNGAANPGAAAGATLADAVGGVVSGALNAGAPGQAGAAGLDAFAQALAAALGEQVAAVPADPAAAPSANGGGKGKTGSNAGGSLNGQLHRGGAFASLAARINMALKAAAADGATPDAALLAEAAGLLAATPMTPAATALVTGEAAPATDLPAPDGTPLAATALELVAPTVQALDTPVTTVAVAIQASASEPAMSLVASHASETATAAEAQTTAAASTASSAAPSPAHPSAGPALAALAAAAQQAQDVGSAVDAQAVASQPAATAEGAAETFGDVAPRAAASTSDTVFTRLSAKVLEAAAPPLAVATQPNPPAPVVGAPTAASAEAAAAALAAVAGEPEVAAPVQAQVSAAMASTLADEKGEPAQVKTSVAAAAADSGAASPAAASTSTAAAGAAGDPKGDNPSRGERGLAVQDVAASDVADVEPEPVFEPAAGETLLSTGPAGEGRAAPVVRGAPETVAALAAQIARKLDARSSRFEIALDPHGMGAVQVSVEINAKGELSAHMQFEKTESAAELRGRAAELTRALEQAGFDLSKGGLSFSDGGARERASDGQNQRRGGARAFQDALLTADAADAAPARPLRLRDHGRAGLDLRI